MRIERMIVTRIGEPDEGGFRRVSAADWALVPRTLEGLDMTDPEIEEAGIEEGVEILINIEKAGGAETVPVPAEKKE